jgi:hypothetical protein
MILLQAFFVAQVVPTGSLIEPFLAASIAIFKGVFHLQLPRRSACCKTE